MSQCITERAYFLWLCKPAWKLTVKFLCTDFSSGHECQLNYCFLICCKSPVCGTWLEHCWSDAEISPDSKSYCENWCNIKRYSGIDTTTSARPLLKITMNYEARVVRRKEKEEIRQMRYCFMPQCGLKHTAEINQADKGMSVKFTPAKTNIYIFLGTDMLKILPFCVFSCYSKVFFKIIFLFKAI